MTQNEREFMRLLPQIRRARDYHLYDSSGKRILDLYQDNGRAWLGHRPEGLSLQLKNTLSRGVYAPYPSSEEGKMLKAFAALLEKLQVSAFSKLRYYRCDSTSIPGESSDPLWEEGSDIMLWRPGLAWPEQALHVEVHVPLPGIEYGKLYASRSDLPEGDIPSPLIAAALNRCLWTLVKSLSTDIPQLELSENWEQKGPYILWKSEEEEYKELFSLALNRGILIPPSFGKACIIPRIRTSSDNTLLQNFFQEN